MADLLPGRREVDGVVYMVAGDGSLVPESVVKAADLLKDEAVRKITEAARPIAEAVKKFRADSLLAVDELVALLAQDYGANLGGKKGNVTLTTYDGTEQLVVAVSEHVQCGPEILGAKLLVDECLREWSADSNDNLRAIINRAFDVDNQGHINRNDLLSLLRLNITDERWLRAMEAIKDSFAVVGSKRYLRMYERPAGDAPWTSITINLAAG